MSRFLLSAAHKSSGKTTVSIGLCAALRERGLSVQPFKKGPDYIDPMWLGAAAGRACRNLDPYLSDPSSLRETFEHHARDADVALVEGNKGLHDGVSSDGRDSSAGLARILGIPVVLVLDTRGTTRGVAPLVLGYQAFDPAVRIAGVILNRVGGSRHESKLRRVIEDYTDVPVLGALGEDASIRIVERHLGLVPSSESTEACERIAAISAAVGAGVDLDSLMRRGVAGEPASGGSRPQPSRVPARGAPGPRIAIARNEAFGFYYPDDLDAFADAGATLVAFDPLRDTVLPEVDGLFIGGGFPETHAPGLSANRGLRRHIRERIAAGLPTYAECGGLMYLSRSLQWGGSRTEMVGAVPGDTVMHERPIGRGYVHLEETADSPWPNRHAGMIKAHEFHYSSLENLPPDLRYAYRVTRGHGIDGARDGLVIGNLLASYAHLRSLAGHDWPARFVAFIQHHASARRPGHVGHRHT